MESSFSLILVNKNSFFESLNINISGFVVPLNVFRIILHNITVHTLI